MVSIVTGFLLGVALTPAAYRAVPPASSVGTGPSAPAGTPVVRHGHLADPARELAVGGHDQRADGALGHLLVDHARRDECGARTVPGERQLALPFARERDVARRRLALERGRDDVREAARLPRLIVHVVDGAEEPWG